MNLVLNSTHYPCVTTQAIVAQSAYAFCSSLDSLMASVSAFWGYVFSIFGFIYCTQSHRRGVLRLFTKSKCKNSPDSY